MSSTTIAVIGSGIIGRTLATRFAQAGHAVTFGTRIPGNARFTAFAAGIGVRSTHVGTAIDDAGGTLYSGPAGQVQHTVEELIRATGLPPV